MKESLFIQWVNKYFPGIVVSVTDKLNDTKVPLKYRYQTMLRKNYSVTGKWESINVANTLVMADVVAMDSPLPLKKRDSISKASGDIPKMGMELKLNERQLTDLDTLVAQNATDAQILAKLFQDTPRCIGGVYERIEKMFLQALSTGVTLVDDDENTGTGIRVDFGYLTANKFGVTAEWSDIANSKPLDDIDRLLEQAKTDGNTPTLVMMNGTDLKNLRLSQQVRNLYATSVGLVITDKTVIPAPSLEQLNTALKGDSQYGFIIDKVDRVVRYEKNGVQTKVTPWNDGSVVFLNDNQVGNLEYATLAEQNHPVAGVNYQTADDFILVSKYAQNKPTFGEFTTSQARVVPVINNVDTIYLLDTHTVQE